MSQTYIHPVTPCNSVTGTVTACGRFTDVQNRRKAWILAPSSHKRHRPSRGTTIALMARMQMYRRVALAAALLATTACRGQTGQADDEPSSQGGSKGGMGGRGSGDGGAAGSAGGMAGQTASTVDVTGQTSGTQPPAAYVAKVKRLINGGVATSEEVAMVTANPASLKTLIDTWMTDPVFKAKMLAFWSEALQQRGNLNSSLTEQLPGFTEANPATLAAVNEMFAMTAWDIVANDRPFNEVVTTRKFMVNTALLVLLSFMDLPPDEGKKRDITIFHNPTPTIIAPADLSESATRKVFALPDAFVMDPTNGGQCSDPMVLNHDTFLRVLLGSYPIPCQPNRLSVPIVTTADLEDWRMVEFTRRPEGSVGTAYYDIAALRKAKTLALRQPRVGFFTTLAFLARNATNEDNDFRVTTNQTLIAALGRAFEDEKVTIPVRTAAVSAEHAVPGTVCWSCHISLDPMRNYFANEFLPNYRAPAMRGTGETSFGFLDVTSDGGDIYKFAETTGDHPDFAIGWTQRLCYWSNSQPCSEEDPEFIRVAQAFKASKFKFKTLLRELLASPLVTAAAETKTQRETNGTIVSVARRSHLCADFANRLMTPDLCQSDATLLRLVLALPDDEYGRGAVAPVQATEPTLINSGTLNAVCDRLATLVVDGKPTSSRITSANAEASFDFIVGNVMGVPSGDPRYTPLRKIVSDHFAAAKSAKANSTQAMRSAFSLACQSPTAAAIGL
ncbi:MAG: hypothetical protein SF187_07075 [Deltaproteobacteria bacterium]|nr:hypothetical protein [Deltaproteobacteria bacterium]